MNINSISFGQSPATCKERIYREARSSQYGDTSPCDCNCKSCEYGTGSEAVMANQGRAHVSMQNKKVPLSDDCGDQSRFHKGEHLLY